MATRWLFSIDGTAKYFVEGETLYAHPGGQASFYISNGWVYTYNGKPTYWIDGDWLYENPGGKAALYFG